MLLLMKKKVLAFYFPFWLFWWKGLIEKSCWHWIFFWKVLVNRFFYYYYFFPLTTAHLVRWSHFCCFFCFWRRLNWGLIKREKEDEKKSWLSLMISPFFINCSIVLWLPSDRTGIVFSSSSFTFHWKKLEGSKRQQKACFRIGPFHLCACSFIFMFACPLMYQFSGGASWILSTHNVRTHNSLHRLQHWGWGCIKFGAEQLSLKVLRWKAAAAVAVLFQIVPVLFMLYVLSDFLLFLLSVVVLSLFSC